MIYGLIERGVPMSIPFICAMAENPPKAVQAMARIHLLCPEKGADFNRLRPFVISSDAERRNRMLPVPENSCMVKEEKIENRIT